MPCPYGIRNQNDAVDVIGHDDKCIQFCVQEMNRDFIPARLHDTAELVLAHFPRHHLAEQVFVVEGADGDEICTGLGVVISR